GGPLIGLSGGAPFVVLPGSPAGLIAADAASATWAVPPVAQWKQSGMASASIVDLGMLGSAVIGIEGYDLVARNAANGSLLHAFPLGAGIAFGTPLPLSVNGLSAPLVGIDWRVEGLQIVQTAVNFATEAVIWTGAPLPYGGYFA